VLCGHSYGGAVITEATAQAGNVAHLVYLAAFCPDEGETVLGLASSADGPTELGHAIVTSVDGTTATLAAERAVSALYGDCSAADIADALGRLGPQPLATFAQPVRGAPWRTVPSTYVVCTQDRAIAPGVQRAMSRRCQDVVAWESGHSPFLSMPGRVAELLAGLAR